LTDELFSLSRARCCCDETQLDEVLKLIYEVDDIRTHHDPIEGLKGQIIEQGYATEDDLKKIDNEIKAIEQSGLALAVRLGFSAMIKGVPGAAQSLCCSRLFSSFLVEYHCHLPFSAILYPHHLLLLSPLLLILLLLLPPHLLPLPHLR
jgi:hypothetical protein